MRIRNLATAGIAVTTLLTFLVPASADQNRTVIERYGASEFLGVGVFMIPVESQDRSVKIEVTDDSGNPVGAGWNFYQGSSPPTNLGNGGFCGASKELNVPTGSDRISISIDRCTSRSAGGLLKVTFSSSPAEFPVNRTSTKSYLGGFGASAGAIARCWDEEGGTGVNGACFPLDGNEGSVDITIADTSGLPVGAAYWFDFNPYDGSGGFTGAYEPGGTFCGATTLHVPVGASKIRVYVDANKLAFNGFFPSGVESTCQELHPPTTGTIRAHFSARTSA